MISPVLIRRIMSFLLTAAIMLTAVAALSADNEYDKLFGLPTDSTAGWTSLSSTVISVNMIRHDDRPAVSFTSELGNVSGKYAFAVKWEEFGADTGDLVLNLNFFISDISALKQNDIRMLPGFISFLSDEGYGFSWNISDFSLKTGWNAVTLNFRTADTVSPEIPGEEDTAETEDEQTTETDVTEETPEQIISSPEEYLPLINSFSFDFEKTTSKDVTIAFSEISVSVRSKGEPPVKPDPITDDIDNGILIAAIIISVLIIAAVIVFSALYAQKEIKRRKREARMLRRERQKNEQNTQ